MLETLTTFAVVAQVRFRIAEPQGPCETEREAEWSEDVDVQHFRRNGVGTVDSGRRQRTVPSRALTRGVRPQASGVAGDLLSCLSRSSPISKARSSWA